MQKNNFDPLEHEPEKDARLKKTMINLMIVILIVSIIPIMIFIQSFMKSLEQDQNKVSWIMETELEKIGPYHYVGYAKENGKEGIRVVTVNLVDCPKEFRFSFPKKGDLVRVELYKQEEITETKSGDLIINLPKDFIKMGILDPQCK